jgi:hypothetical protein
MLRTKYTESEEEDVSFLAGWMYADLFLAMMVIFLATVTFVPEYLGKLDETATNSAYNYREIYKKPMVVAYDGFDAKQIEQDVAAFLRAEKLSQDSDIIYVQVVGPYDPKTESAADAISRAQIFSRKLDMVNSGLFMNASTTLSSTTSIPINRIAVKFTFAVNFGVKEIQPK